LRLAVGRTRDVQSDLVTSEAIDELDRIERPTRLFSVNGTLLNDLPETVRQYIRHGEELGLHRKALISTRRPWYKMESRPVPPILFAYLGRRNARFVRNVAGVLPLTGFLCVYPSITHPEFVQRLNRVLQHPDTIANLALVGKSYGSGAVKVEPRALERLPLPLSVVAEAGLSDFIVCHQPSLVMENSSTYQLRSEPREGR
jgi:adenine-specific DNA-methyltransferase